METLLFTAVRDEDGKYRVPANSVSVNDQPVAHAEVASQSLLGLLYGHGSLNEALSHLGTWRAAGKACQFSLETEIAGTIKVPFRIIWPQEIQEGPTPDIIALFDARNAARHAKDFGRADSIRDELKNRGWEINDAKSGPKLRRVKP